MVFYDEIDLEAHINNQYICLKNNTAQLYFILREANQCWKFSYLLRDAPGFHRFLSVHMVKTHSLLENLSISELSLGIIENSNVGRLSLI